MGHKQYSEVTDCQTYEVIFRVLSRGSTPKLKAIWYTTEVGVSSDPAAALTVAFLSRLRSVPPRLFQSSIPSHFLL